MPRYIFRDRLLQMGQRTTGARNHAAAKAPIARQQANEVSASADFRSFHDGTFERTRLGRQADGTYGIRVWDSAGVLQFDQTFA